MDNQAVLETWRRLFPTGICLAAGPLLEDARPLTSRERASAGVIDAKRTLELENGREYARRALQTLGFCNAELTVKSDRSVLWPSGVVGSITHVMGSSTGYFAAAVARNNSVQSIGIDVEYETGLHPNVWSYVLTRREFERVLTLSPEARPIEAQVVWCAKEAVTKAAQQSIDPLRIEIDCDSTGSNMAIIHEAAFGGGTMPGRWLMRTARVQGLILAAAYSVLPERQE
jgi:4'-phosphopantetheinyl transferase EntD